MTVIDSLTLAYIEAQPGIERADVRSDGTFTITWTNDNAFEVGGAYTVRFVSAVEKLAEAGGKQMKGANND